MNTRIHSRLSMLGGAAVAIGLIGVVSAQDSELVGTWNCSGSAEDAELGMTMSGTIEQTFAANGTYEREGKIELAIAALQIDIAFGFDESGNWRRDGMTIAETPTEVEISSSSAMPSQIEQMMLDQMQAEAQSELNAESTTQISSLSATTMVLDEGDGFETTCEKV